MAGGRGSGGRGDARGKEAPSGGESFAALFEAGRPSSKTATVRLQVGQELDVSVVQIGKDAVFVGLDEKREGFIEAAELTGPGGELTVKTGTRLRARVVELEGRPGAVRLTPVFVAAPRAEAPSEPDAAPAAVVANPGVPVVGATVKGTVSGVERYGVFLQLEKGGGGKGRGLRGLIPVSELGLPRGADLHKTFPVGSDLAAMVVAIDEQGRIRLSLSQLAVDEERRSFQAFEEKSKGKTGAADRGARGFGTLGDLLAKSRK